MLCKGKPILNSKGHRINDRWKWDKVIWNKCNVCNMWHSNRSVSPEYLDGDWGVSIQKKTKVGILLIKNDLAYMTETYHTSIGFPKGEKENGETIEECAEREFYEETGTKIKINKYKYKKIKLNIYNVLYIFYVIIVNEFDIITHPKDTKEVTSYGWFNIHKIRFLDNVSNVSKIVLCLYKNHLNFTR